MEKLTEQMVCMTLKIMMDLSFYCMKILLIVAGIVALCAGCGLLSLPFAVTEDALEGAGAIVEEVGEAL